MFLVKDQNRRWSIASQMQFNKWNSSLHINLLTETWGLPVGSQLALGFLHSLDPGYFKILYAAAQPLQMAQLTLCGTSKALAFVPCGDGRFSDFHSIPEVTIHHIIVKTLVPTTGLHLHMGEFCWALHLIRHKGNDKYFFTFYWNEFIYSIKFTQLLFILKFLVKLIS